MCNRSGNRVTSPGLHLSSVLKLQRVKLIGLNDILHVQCIHFMLCHVQGNKDVVSTVGTCRTRATEDDARSACGPTTVVSLSPDLQKHVEMWTRQEWNLT